jgi:hypothetical protein
MANKPQLTGIIILFAGVALLAFTFINAYFFLLEPFAILTTSDLSAVFGEALAPLIQACIRLMYLGIMGWIGSLLTVRSIPLVTYKYIPTPAPTQVQPQTQPQPKPALLKPTPQPKPQAQPKPAAQPVAQPSPPQPQPKPQPQPQPQSHEPQAILIPPEKQREE